MFWDTKNFRITTFCTISVRSVCKYKFVNINLFSGETCLSDASIYVTKQKDYLDKSYKLCNKTSNPYSHKEGNFFCPGEDFLLRLMGGFSFIWSWFTS